MTAAMLQWISAHPVAVVILGAVVWAGKNNIGDMSGNDWMRFVNQGAISRSSHGKEVIYWHERKCPRPRRMLHCRT